MLSEIATRTSLACVFAFPAFVAVELAHECLGWWRWLGNAVVILSGVGVWLALDGSLQAQWSLVQWGLLTGAAIALASCVPACGPKSEGRWWRVNVETIQAAIVGAAFAVIAFLGLALAHVSIQSLFDLKANKLMQSAFFICGMGVGPVVMLTRLPALANGGHAPALAGVWRALVRWLLIPLGLLYSSILLTHALRIGIAGELPAGMVALPVLVLGAYGTASMLLLQPWRDSEWWARFFARLYPPVFLALSTLLFIAFWVRIADYGVTLERYLGVACGLLFVGCAVCFLLIPKRAVLAVPLLFAVLAIVGAVGPVSGEAWTLRSQSHRLKAMLAAFREGDSTLEDQIAKDLASLTRTFGLRGAESVVGPMQVNGEKLYVVERETLRKAGVGKSESRSNQRVFSFMHRGAVPLPSPGRLWVADSESPTVIGRTEGSREFTVGVYSGELAARRQGRTLHTFPFGPVTNGGETPPSFEWESEGRRFLVVVTQAEWSAQTKSLLSAKVLVFER